MRKPQQSEPSDPAEDDVDDATFLLGLFEPLRRESPTPPRQLAARSIRRARLDVLLRDVVDFVAMRFLHRPIARSDETADEPPERNE